MILCAHYNTTIHILTIIYYSTTHLDTGKVDRNWIIFDILCFIDSRIKDNTDFLIYIYILTLLIKRQMREPFRCVGKMLDYVH